MRLTKYSNMIEQEMLTIGIGMNVHGVDMEKLNMVLQTFCLVHAETIGLVISQIT